MLRPVHVGNKAILDCRLDIGNHLFLRHAFGQALLNEVIGILAEHHARIDEALAVGALFPHVVALEAIHLGVTARERGLTADALADTKRRVGIDDESPVTVRRDGAALNNGSVNGANVKDGVLGARAVVGAGNTGGHEIDVGHLGDVSLPDAVDPGEQEVPARTRAVDAHDKTLVGKVLEDFRGLFNGNLNVALFALLLHVVERGEPLLVGAVDELLSLLGSPEAHDDLIGVLKRVVCQALTHAVEAVAKGNVGLVNHGTVRQNQVLSNLGLIKQQRIQLFLRCTEPRGLAALRAVQLLVVYLAALDGFCARLGIGKRGSIRKSDLHNRNRSCGRTERAKERPTRHSVHICFLSFSHFSLRGRRMHAGGCTRHPRCPVKTSPQKRSGEALPSNRLP